MQLIPLIYLKNAKAVQPAETEPSWFQENGLELARIFSSQGAEALYINDLNIPATGKSENLPVMEAIQKNLQLKLWVTGNFKSIASMEPYAELGVEKIVLGASAYQIPSFVKEASQKFPKKIAVLIEVKNKRVVVPGLVAPSHKTAQDYANRFEEEGASALCYTTDGDLEGIHEFCKQAKAPVLALQDIQAMEDLRKCFEFESAGLIGIVVGKPLYENRLDLHSSVSFLNDLAVASVQETTHA